MMVGAEEIKELAERLLSYVGPGGMVPAVQLLPGRLPDDPEFNFSPPPGSRILGTMIREPGWQLPRDLDWLLDAPGNEQDVLHFYEQHLKERGWVGAPQGGNRPGGFQVGPQGESRLFRRGDGLAVHIMVRPVRPEWVEVRLRSQWMPANARHEPPAGWGLIPELRQPAGVRVMSLTGGSGGGSGGWTSEAIVEGDFPVAELESHFARQLEAVGWKRVAGSASGPLAWSTWTLPENTSWYGYLFALELPGQNRRLLWVRLEPTGPSGSGGGRGSAIIGLQRSV